MSGQSSFDNVDSLLFQFALQTRELAQKKNEISQQIKVYRADIAERKSYIGTTQKDIRDLEEKIKATQTTLIHCKEFAKSLKMTYNLRAQVQQMLKDELESRTVSYNQDKEVYEERIASYKKTFQSHKEYHCQNPLAQKLLALQAENESIESRIRACDDQITMKQKELGILTGPGNSSSNEKLSDSDPGQKPPAELEEHLDSATVEGCDPSIDISSLHLYQMKDGQITSVEVNAKETCEEDIIQNTVAHVQEEETTGMASCPPVYEQRWPDVTHSEEDNQNTAPVDQGEESAELDKNEERMEEKVEVADVKERDQALSTENEEPTSVPPSSSQETNPQSSPSAVGAASTPTFPFDFSPGSSPRHGTSDTKSPAFLFSLNSDPSTPGFSGFGFDVCSSKDEESSFAFNSPFFSEKKTSGSKSPGCSDFPFGQAEQSEDFQFAFGAKSPQPDKKDNSGDEFPFSFNF